MTIRWLHLSDTHFREDELWDRRATLRALIAKVSELKAKGLAPDMVFVTGDIAWSGKAKEYEQATRFFHELNEVLDLDPKDRWFLVPGNHDVDRSRITRSHRAIQDGLTNETIVEETLRDPDSMRLLSARLECYYNFAADFLGIARALQPDRPWRTDVREFDGFSVGVLQLNSAWIAEGGKVDEANLLVGEVQVREATDATPDAFLRIALMHHPIASLRPFDADRVESLLGGKDGVAFLLRGHLHRNQTKIQYSPDHYLHELAAGTLYTDEAIWPRGFHLGEVDLDKGEARIHLFRYSGEAAGFFVPDNLTYENARDGICKIKLPAAYRRSGNTTKPSKTISEAQRISFIARYRTAAANYHGYARFIGFPNQAARMNASVSDLFVPLRMKGKSGNAKAASLTTADIAQLLLGAEADGSARIVVLGDPGSGKTTISRFLVMLAAGAIAMPGVKVNGEPLPLRVAFRDFVEKQRETPNLSLLDYLEIQARTELSLALPKNFLSKAMENGHAILLLDGLDEVGAPEHRAAMRDLVAGFSASHRKLPMLVTSRIAGYDDAPLRGRSILEVEKRPLVPFETIRLEKFDDDDLRTFVARWYAIQEPTDPIARDRGIGDLLAALNADARVRELARTPILATLIAMIHRVEANLPGERAKLYELCVRMLIETWPAQAKRPFAQIDAGLQRAYLESLAFDMQIGRQEDNEAVMVTRGDLIARLLPILQKRDFASEPSEKVEGVIERWIDHLEKHSGILVEQSTGVCAFFHLSIMEYLAARGLERERGRDGALASIVGHFKDAAWREVCLLAVGSHAEDGNFLDEVYEGIRESKPVERWDFLLRCLREEAYFRPEQRETILAQYAATLLQHGPGFTDLSLIDQIQSFSIRHGEAVRRWIEQRLDNALGDELVATAAITMKPNPRLVSSRLAIREDKAAAAGSLLEFRPGSALGAWAADEADTPAALAWSRTAPLDLAPLRGVFALCDRETLAAASLIVLNGRTLQLYLEGARNVSRVAYLPREGGHGLPDYINIEPGHWTLATEPRAPRRPGSLSGGVYPRFARAIARNFARDFARKFARNFVRDFDHDFVRGFAQHFVRAFGLDFAHDFVRDFARYFNRNFTRAFDRAFDRDFSPAFSSYFPRVTHDFTRDFARDFTTASPPDRPLMPALRVSTTKKGARRAGASLLAPMAGEGWIALVTTSESECDDERLGYFLLRTQNRWLFEVWSAIDRRLPENPSPTHLALYFALGWAQSTTTWAWPDSERWRTLFAAGPGEHWLVRSQWHLCKLTDDPASKDDDAGLRAALRDGHGDESLPGYAARLSEVLGIEG